MKNSEFGKKLIALIKDSRLNTEEKMLWGLFVRLSVSEEDEAIYEAAVENEENLNLLTTHLRDKIWDMKTFNEEKWKEIIKDEEKFAELLEYKDDSSQ